MKYRLIHVVEYVLVRTVVAVIRALPYRAALFIGWLIAAFSHRVLRFRVGAAKARIREVFGARFTECEVARIARLSWRNFLFCVIDLIRLQSVTPDWIKTRVSGWEQSEAIIRSHVASGKGAVIACPHMGAWEMAGVALQILGVPIFFLTGKQKNPLVDAYLNRLRGSTGIDTVQRGSAMVKGALRRLKDGRFLAFLPDVGTSSDGVSVQFLGGHANVPAGMALFARQAGAPIFTGLAARIGWSRHVMRIEPPIWPDDNAEKKQDWQRMTQEVFNLIDREIREKPEQWFWFNKRWILAK